MNLAITDDDRRYMEYALDISKQSKDTSRKTGCVFVVDGSIRAEGFNSFPKGVIDLPERRERPAKYLFTEHCELVAITYAARVGVPLRDATVYLPWFPCCPCARALVGVGTKRLVCYAPDWEDTRYNFKEAATILNEGGVSICIMPGTIGEPQ